MSTPPVKICPFLSQINLSKSKENQLFCLKSVCNLQQGGSLAPGFAILRRSRDKPGQSSPSLWLAQRVVIRQPWRGEKKHKAADYVQLSEVLTRSRCVLFLTDSSFTGSPPLCCQICVYFMSVSSLSHTAILRYPCLRPRTFFFFLLYIPVHVWPDFSAYTWSSDPHQCISCPLCRHRSRFECCTTVTSKQTLPQWNVWRDAGDGRIVYFMQTSYCDISASWRGT